jgi:pilus assembly protein CpaB
MARSRLLIVVALVLILLAAGGGAAYWFILGPGANQGGGGGPAIEPTPIPVTATPEPVLYVLVASQNLDRGMIIPTEAIANFPWPTAIVPFNAVTDTAVIVGTRARIPIDRGMPILSNMVVKSLAQLSPNGSDAAAQIPAGLTAITLPYDKRNGVALGIQAGDHVNIIVTLWVVDIDENFQTLLPNLTTNVQPPSPGSPEAGIPAGLVALIQPAVPGSGVGRSEREPTIGQDVYVVPSEPQARSRLVTQGIIQDATVLRMGDFGQSLFPTLPPPTPSPDPAVTQPPAPLPTNTPLPPESMTLMVSPQDALVINYVKELMLKYPGAVQLTFTLRSAGDTSVASTESVTMQYMFERFNISVPSKLNYGLDKSLPTPLPPATPIP